MTVDDVINKFDNLRRNTVGFDEKVDWLRELEKKVLVDILRNYDGYRNSETRHDDIWVDDKGSLHLPPYMYVNENMQLVMDSFEPINLPSYVYRNENGTVTIGEMADGEFDRDSELSIPEPYTEIYLHYLDMKVSYWNNDARIYNIAAQEYNNAYLAYQQWYNRTHTVDRPRGHLIRHEVL